MFGFSQVHVSGFITSGLGFRILGLKDVGSRA